MNKSTKKKRIKALRDNVERLQANAHSAQYASFPNDMTSMGFAGDILRLIEEIIKELEHE